MVGVNDDDLLPRATRHAPSRERHASSRERHASSRERHEQPAARVARERHRRHAHEIAFGVTLALVAAIAITWWMTSSREPRPSFAGDSAPTFVGSLPTNVSGGPAPTTLPSTATTATPSAATRATLLTTYEAMHSVYRASRSYRTISLATLGHLLPTITIEEGDASSTNARVVSLLTPAADRVVLAVRDDAGCEWLRDYGRGAQLAVQRAVVVTCSADAAPTTGWAPA